MGRNVKTFLIQLSLLVFGAALKYEIDYVTFDVVAIRCCVKNEIVYVTLILLLLI